MSEQLNRDLLSIKEELGDFDEMEDINELIRLAEEIIQDNRSRFSISQEPPETLTRQVNEILQEPVEPEVEPSPVVIPAEDEDDDVVYINYTPGPPIIDLSIPTPPPRITSARRRMRTEIQTTPDSPVTSSRRRQHDEITSVPPAKASRLPNDLDSSLDDSINSTKIRLQCPICMESAVHKNPASTVCGHIFCEACIIKASKLSKKCPICKKPLKSKNSFHRLYL